jgi:hypothetical protein
LCSSERCGVTVMAQCYHCLEQRFGCVVEWERQEETMANGEFGENSDQGNPYAAPESPSAASQPASGEVPGRLQGGASVGEIFNATSELFGTALESGVLWLVVFLQGLVAVVSQAPAIMLEGRPPSSLGGSDAAMFFAIYLFLFLASCVSVTLYRPLRKLYFIGPRAFEQAGDALSDALSRFGAALGYMFVVGIIVVVGLILLIIPGLIAAISLPLGLYLIVASDSLGVGDTVSESWGLFKRNWGSIIAAGLAYFLALLVALIPVYVALFSAGLGESIVARTCINAVIGVPTLIFYAAMLCRVEVDDRMSGRSRSVWEQISMPTDEAGR